MAKSTIDITCHVKHHGMAMGWSQDELAQKIGVRRQAVYDTESGMDQM